MATKKPETPQNPKQQTKNSISTQDATILSPNFRSVAAMAGWDEEALLASLVVEDTPDREPKHPKRINSQSKTTPPASSKRKRHVHRQSSSSIPIVVLDMDDETVQDDGKESAENDKKKEVPRSDETKENLVEEDCGKKDLDTKSSPVPSSSSDVPCMDRLKEELSCAICLDICFEPSTTSCGHSFCKKCLISATEKCGKRCPKCRELISNVGRNCPVNTVLWNTIQLLFPQEVEMRKAVQSVKTQDIEPPKPEKKTINNVRNRTRRVPVVIVRDDANGARRSTVGAQAAAANGATRRTSVVGQAATANGARRRSTVGGRAAAAANGARRRSNVGGQATNDAELALRLQREEFLQVFSPEHSRTSMAAARNLRAMASAMTLRF